MILIFNASYLHHSQEFIFDNRLSYCILVSLGAFKINLGRLFFYLNSLYFYHLTGLYPEIRMAKLVIWLHSQKVPVEFVKEVLHPEEDHPPLKHERSSVIFVFEMKIRLSLFSLFGIGHLLLLKSLK